MICSKIRKSIFSSCLFYLSAGAPRGALQAKPPFKANTAGNGVFLRRQLETIEDLATRLHEDKKWSHQQSPPGSLDILNVENGEEAQTPLMLVCAGLGGNVDPSTGNCEACQPDGGVCMKLTPDLTIMMEDHCLLMEGEHKCVEAKCSLSASSSGLDCTMCLDSRDKHGALCTRQSYDFVAGTFQCKDIYWNGRDCGACSGRLGEDNFEFDCTLVEGPTSDVISASNSPAATLYSAVAALYVTAGFFVTFLLHG